MADVYEYIIDGTSGLVPGGVDGKIMVVGQCSKGTPGKAYLVGKRTDLKKMFGEGELNDRLEDIFQTSGQESVVVAVPIQIAPVPTIADIMRAIDEPLELFDVESVYICGASDKVAWAAAQAKADELWSKHRPTYFKMEARMPKPGENLNNWVAALKKERADFAGRFVTVCSQFGQIVTAKGEIKESNWAGLQVGRTLAIPVQRSQGRVKDGPIVGVTLPVGWSNIQSTLEEAGFLTAKKYAGLNGVYWGDAKTMADITSDYQYEPVVRTAFKAIRKMRLAALKSMYDEIGDPLNSSSSGGLAYLKAQLELALDTMVKANPKELAGYVIEIPPGQDFVNNGVVIETTLIGLPIIRKIKLFASYVYAGSTFDPRLK